MSFSGDLIKSGILTDGKNITIEGNIRSSNLLTTRGKIWYVHSGVGSDVASRGKLATKPFATWDYAIGKCSANRGDIIYLLAGHAETVATAGAIAVDVVGVTSIGLGEGADKPTFTFSDVDATITVSAASNVVAGILLKPSIDSVVSPIVVSAADCMIDVEVQDKTALIECVNAILTTAAADRLTINLKYRGFTAGDACVNAIRLIGVDTARINVDFYGKASTAIVEFHTTLSTDINITGHFWNEGTSLTKNVVETVGSNTWSITGWDGEASANFSGGDHAALALDDTSAVNTIVTTIASDLILVDTVVDTIASDLIVLDAIVDGEVTKTTTIASDLLLVDAVVDTVASDLVVLDAIVDGEVTKTATIASDLLLVDTVVDTVASDLIVADALIDTIKSDLIVLDAIVDAEVIKTATIASDLVVMDALIDAEVVKTATIASDLVVMDALIDTVRSDLIVLDAIVDTVAGTVGKIVSKAYADLTGYDDAVAFTVTGDVLVRIIGAVGATGITSTSGTTTLTLGTTEDVDGIIAATTIDNAQLAATDVWVDATPTEDVDKMADGSWHVVSGGADITLFRNVDDITAGTLTLYCWWIPLSTDGNVVAA